METLVLPSRKVKNVLLVDDDETSNFMHQLLLEDLQVAGQIYVSLNGKEALDFLRTNCLEPRLPCPELILLDINMPVMNGFEFLDKFQYLPFRQAIRVVLLTSSVNAKDAEKASAYPVSGLVNKPLTEEKLKELLDE